MMELFGHFNLVN